MRAYMRWFMAAAIVLGVAASVHAQYESEDTRSSSADSSSSGDDFNKAADVDRYLEGNVQATTLAMIRNVGTALHNDNLKTQQQMAELKNQMQQLEDQVRRMSSGSHQPAGDSPASSRGSRQ